jgi:hypothetical protein
MDTVSWRMQTMVLADGGTGLSSGVVLTLIQFDTQLWIEWVINKNVVSTFIEVLNTKFILSDDAKNTDII